MIEMNLIRLATLIPVIVIAVTLLLSISSGKTLSPMQGTQPFIVNKRLHPARYWFGIVILIGLFMMAVFFAYKVLSMPNE